MFLLLLVPRYVPFHMFASLLQLLTGRPPPELEHSAFVQEIRVTTGERRNPRLERIILICWLAIANKHGLVLWAVYRYHIPFSPLWVNAPTWLLGVLATGIYYWHTRSR